MNEQPFLRPVDLAAIEPAVRPLWQRLGRAAGMLTSLASLFVLALLLA